jgi:phosphatidylserine/phosphatidylglycerophosphate/cardiolipin synthase-like enzyme
LCESEDYMMKTFLFAAWFVLSVSAVWACEVQPLFSPYDKVDDAIHVQLKQASKSVHCSLYGITNLRLANDLIAVKKRGADVGVGLDKIQASGKHDLHDKLQAGGILVEIKPVATFEHNKFCVLDGSIVITGSWNWSNNAQRQDNSDVIITDCPKVAHAFETAYQRIMERDKPQ